MPPETAFLLTRILIGIGIVISSLEWLAVPDLFLPSGLLSWRVLRQRPSAISIPSWMGFVLDAGGVKRVFWLRAVGGALLCLPLLFPMELYVLGVVLALSILISNRNVVGGDGSDQMTVIVLAGLCIAALPLPARAQMAGFALIAGQSMLSYAVAGVAKLMSPEWRSGAAMPLILRTATYGERTLATWCAGHRPAARLMCCATILFEVTFPLALFAPTGLFVTLIVIGTAFHLANAILMGLNIFSWAFVAAYPSIVVCRAWLAA